eukprot:Lithocolla_globosa_v1_NODE_1445_length_2570_cov_22.229423.p1 type:complete len:526 gc:universal NODE_1445_length_2570_cov_22.229423:774-2351(+)
MTSCFPHNFLISLTCNCDMGKKDKNTLRADTATSVASHSEDFYHIYVARRDKLEIKVEISAPNSYVYWNIRTEDHDIGFGVTKTDANGPEVVVLPLERRNCHIENIQGEVICSDGSTVTLVFDNTFSMTKGKNVYYKISREEPTDEKGQVISTPISAWNFEQKPLVETEEIRKEALAAIRAEIEKNSLDLKRTDDAFLLRYLRCEHYEIDRAYKKLVGYSKWTKESQIFQAGQEPVTFISTRPLFKQIPMYFLPTHDKMDRSILYLLGRNLYVQEPQTLYLRYIVCLLEYVLSTDEKSMMNGIITCGSVTGVGKKQLSPNNPIRPELANIMQSVYALRVGKMCMFNSNKLIQAGFSVVSSLLNERMRSRIEFFGPENHFDVKKSGKAGYHVRQMLDMNHLPAEFSGTLPESALTESFLNVLKWSTEGLKLSLPASENSPDLEWKSHVTQLHDNTSGVVMETIEESGEESLEKKLGLKITDVILSINNKSVHNNEGVKSVLKEMSGKELQLEVRRTTKDIFGNSLQ